MPEASKAQKRVMDKLGIDYDKHTSMRTAAWKLDEELAVRREGGLGKVSWASGQLKDPITCDLCGGNKSNPDDVAYATCKHCGYNAGTGDVS